MKQSRFRRKSATFFPGRSTIVVELSSGTWRCGCRGRGEEKSARRRRRLGAAEAISSAWLQVFPRCEPLARSRIPVEQADAAHRWGSASTGKARTPPIRIWERDVARIPRGTMQRAAFGNEANCVDCVRYDETLLASGVFKRHNIWKWSQGPDFQFSLASSEGHLPPEV